MWLDLAMIFLMALCGALLVPVIVVLLARFRYFPALEFRLFGKLWLVPPRPMNKGGGNHE